MCELQGWGAFWLPGLGGHRTPPPTKKQTKTTCNPVLGVPPALGAKGPITKAKYRQATSENRKAKLRVHAIFCNSG